VAAGGAQEWVDAERPRLGEEQKQHPVDDRQRLLEAVLHCDASADGGHDRSAAVITVARPHFVFGSVRP